MADVLFFIYSLVRQYALNSYNYACQIFCWLKAFK